MLLPTSAILRKDDAPILHLVCNFAVGQTAWSSYWQQQISSLQQEAVAFQSEKSQAIPTLLLQHDAVSSLSVLFEASHNSMDQWPTWCTFLCPEQGVSMTFLLLSLNLITGTEQHRATHHQRIVLCFQHNEHLRLIEAIEREGQMILSGSAPYKEFVVPFPDSELVVHLEYVRLWYR